MDTTNNEPVYALLDETKPDRFEVQLFSELSNEPDEVHETYGSWTVEDAFLILWNEEGLRRAIRLPHTVTRIESNKVTIDQDESEGVAENYAESAE